ncbi:Glutathione reductase [Phytophthora nicotianae]|uniref:Glutathione reductase n=1 Tax=Phytophthora nicotianae TaxID=4792 RepID=A0A0W8DSG5_PHYNI|nr:Glutathione reductase [Phytophthora nicotianae]
MCETPNPSPSAPRELGTASSDWSCAACTMVNPAAMRVCGVCGTLNPRPPMPPGLSIRLSDALGGGDDSFSSSSEDSEDSDSGDEEEDTWTCTTCDSLSSGRTCANCFAQHDDDMDDELEGEGGYFMDYDDDDEDDGEDFEGTRQRGDEMSDEEIPSDDDMVFYDGGMSRKSRSSNKRRLGSVSSESNETPRVHAQLQLTVVYLSSPYVASDSEEVVQGIFNLPSDRKKGISEQIEQLNDASACWSIITQEEAFPLVSFNIGKGRELYPLARQLKIAVMRPGDRGAGDRPPGGSSSRLKGKSIHSSPLTHFQSFERTVSRSMPVIDSDLSLLYLNLVGHSIQKVVEGKWRKFLVVGYDDTRCYHLLKPIGGTNDDLAEMVLHDSQCKLIDSVNVYEGVTLDLELFGSPDGADSGGNSDGKKKRKNNKRKRKSSTQKQQQLENEGTLQVEVKNSGMLKMRSLPGAWYAAILLDDSGEVRKSSEGKNPTCEEVLAAQATHSVKLLPENRIVRKVPADCIRPRALQPQIGSVVEMDGCLGEVTRIYNNDRSSSSAANTFLDVKVNSYTEKKRVKKDRVRFPAQELPVPKDDDESDQIEAMSIRRLFPARDSSLLAGSVGDRVWVLPPSGSSVTDICVAGTIKNFPSGLDSIRDSSTVVVEIAFGSAQPSLAVKVNQDRILNFAVDGGVLSGRGPSRLLAALQMASGRGGSSRLFGGGRSGQDSSTSAIHRAFERVAGSLQQNRLGGGLGSSGSAMDHIRSLMSRNSNVTGPNAPSDIETAEQAPTTAQGAARANSPPNEPSGSDVQADEEASASVTASSSNSNATSQRTSSVGEKSSKKGTSTVETYLKKPQGAKPKMTCTQLPKVNLVVGFRKCDASVPSQDRIVISSEFGLERVDRNKVSKDTPATPLLTRLDPSTQRYEPNAGVRKALLDVFHSFSKESVSGASQKKKRRKLSPDAQRKASAEAAPWDVEKFIAFMLAVRGPSQYDHPGSNAKYCVTFSKFADPETNRRLLAADGFLALIVHECKDAVKSKQLLKFLRSRGYSEKSLTSSGSRSSSGDDEEKDSPNSASKSAHTKIPGNKLLRQPVVLRGFPADQNVLKCLEDLRQEHRTRACTSTLTNDASSSGADAVLPPWKLTYKLYCDFQVEWETQSSSNTSTSESLGSGAMSLESLAVLESKPPTRVLLHGIVELDEMNASSAAEASRWLSRITAPQTGSGKVNVSDSVASAASKKLRAGEQSVQIDQMDVQDWLEAVGFTFIDPFSQAPLVTGGDDIAVTASNLTLYVRAVLELWLDSGIRAQVQAFREGISEVLPVGKLRLLFVPELISLLCGEEDIEWNVESLVKDTKLAHGYTKDSQPVQFFFEALEEMSAAERRAFLLYATGCPNLPPGGFQALKPPFEVVRRVVDNLDVDRALPFARTCTNTLHLPAYSSKDVLVKQMTFAIANSRGVIDRD